MARRIGSLLALPFVGLVRAYQKLISPLLPARCKYYPTCSSYALQALREHGLGKGLALTCWRLLRCNPWSLGGVDYPPQKGSWKSGEYKQMSADELQAHWDRLDGRTHIKEEGE